MLKGMHASVCNSGNFSLLEKSLNGRAKLELLTHIYLKFHVVKSMQVFDRKLEIFKIRRKIKRSIEVQRRVRDTLTVEILSFYSF
jgi:hypothetical protein